MERSSRKPLPGVVASLLRLVGVLVCLVGPTVPAEAWASTLLSESIGHRLLQDAVVRTEPQSVQVAVGETVTVDVRIDNVTDLDYAELYYLTFDPDLLEVVDADPYAEGIQIEPGPFLGLDSTVWKNVVYDDGDIHYAQWVKSESVSDSGVLATITFRGKAVGTSALEFNEVYLEDPNGVTIDASVQDGSITVTEAEAPTPTHIPTSTPSPTDTPTPTSPGPTDTPTPTSPGPTPTPTRKPTPGPSPTPVSGDTPTPTHTPTPGPPPTSTSIPAPAPTHTSTPAAVARDVRVLQLWPDRSRGASSTFLESSTAHVTPQMLPFGVYRTATGDVVRARTYLHFPVNVFPPGTAIRRATLYVHVDGISNVGEATFGAYRVLEPWAGDESWSDDPSTWPALLTAPIATEKARFDVLTSTLPLSIPVPTDTPAFVPTPILTTTESSALLFKPAGHALGLTPTSPASPLVTPVPALSSPASAVTLQEAAGTWLAWDVTVLVWAWLAGDVPDDGLALGPGPGPDASPETAGNLLVASWFTDADVSKGPYIVAEFEVFPVTPTPLPTYTPTSMPVLLPYAGSPSGWGAAGGLLIGAALLILGLVVRRRHLGLR